MKTAVLYILISVLGGGIGQILLKQGMSSMGPLTLEVGQMGAILWRMGTNLYVLGGLVIYGASTVFWLSALSRVDLSFAYPFVSLSYVVMLIAAWQIFQEDISALRLLGTMVVGLGVLLVARG